MACCSRKKTDGKEVQSIKNESDQSSEKIKPIIPSKKASNSEIEYLITIKTGDHRNSGTDGPVYIKIFGQDNKQTDDILLPNSFRYDSIEKIQIKAIDIGKPQRIIIRHEYKTNGWFIDYVEISVHNFLIRFVANRWLNETKHDRKLSVELFGSEQPAADYNIEIRTGSEQIEPLDSPVYMQIFGTTSVTPKLFLESKYASYTKDSIAKFNISSNNVGEIQKIVIGHENLGKINDWYIENVKIQTTEQQYEFIVNKWLSSTKDNKQLFIELNPEHNQIIKYFITIKTIDVQRNDIINNNIQMSIHGSNENINKRFLKDFIKSNNQQIFQKDHLDQFEIQAKYIENIKSITIGFNDNEQTAALLLESIDIKYKEKLYHFQVDYWLSSRLGTNFSWITIQSDRNTNDNIIYHITIETGKSDIDINAMLCIYGDKNLTKIYSLRIKKDHIKVEFNFKGIDVGRIEKINIGYNEMNNDEQWFLKSIEIEKKDEYYLFNHHRYLNEKTGRFIDLLPEESKSTVIKDLVIYTITIATSSEDDSGTDSGVFMTIYGDKDRTKQFSLMTTKENSHLLFKQNEINQFEIELNDVGNINKINIGQDGKGLHPIWHLKTVEIQKGSEIYKFYANQILDYSTPDIDLFPIPPKKSLSPAPMKSSTPRSSTSEITYKISTQFHSLKKTTIPDDANLYIIIIGDNNRTKKFFLLNNTIEEQEFQTNDVGKISKILLGQNKNQHDIIWHIDNIIIKHNNQTTIFNINRLIKQNTEIEVSPTETPIVVVKTRDDDYYEIKTTTGETKFEGKVNIKLRGENGIISIPLLQSISGVQPFQAKANDIFTCRTTDVGNITRLIIEINDIKPDQIWHLKKIQIIKGKEIYNFNADVHFNDKKQKFTLHPVTKIKEDYVQSELRRLRQNLRTTSAKMRRPPHKPHEPFVYNDLRPYFDTTTVEKAIHEPLETPPGYYTRLTALRIVEPWEAYGMDYGVSYELLKRRTNRGHSAKRSLSTRTGMMILPPLSLPYGGQIAYVNPANLSHSRSSSARHRSLCKNNNEQTPTTA